MNKLSQVQLINVENLKFLESNPRSINDDEFNNLKKDIVSDPEFFNLRPCLVNDSSGELIVYAGNQRLRAAIELGWKKVPCIVSTITDNKIQKIRTAQDNLHRGQWNVEILADEFSDIDLKDLGLDFDFEKYADSDKAENKEIQIQSVENDLQNECPKCHFKFN